MSAGEFADALFLAAAGRSGGFLAPRDDADELVCFFPALTDVLREPACETCPDDGRPALDDPLLRSWELRGREPPP